MTFLRRTLIAATTAALLGASLSALAQDIKPRLIRFGYGLNEQSNQGRAAKVFSDAVDKASGGKMKVRAIGAAALGPDTQMQQALIGGAQEMMVGSTATLVGITKEMAIWDTPFMIANTKEADAMLDGPIGDKIKAKLQEKGLVGLVYWENGFRNLTNSKRAINKVADLEGLKLRVIPNPVNVDWVKAVGANPTPLPFPEVYAALEQKAIDGQENPITVINANKFFEVQKFVALTNHQYNPQSVIMSKKFWDSLSAAEKTIVQDAATESAKVERAAARGQVAGALASMKSNGMTVTELPAAEMTILRDKMKPVIAKHGEPIAATVAELQAELAKLRK